MNTLKSAAILILAISATAASVASAAEPVAVPVTARAQITRAEVKQELQLAIANGEIRHGDLVDFESLLATATRSTALASNVTQPAQSDAAADIQNRTAQAANAGAKSSGH